MTSIATTENFTEPADRKVWTAPSFETIKKNRIKTGPMSGKEGGNANDPSASYNS